MVDVTIKYMHKSVNREVIKILTVEVLIDSNSGIH